MRAGGKALKVLVIEPYYGGSHKSFISGLLSLPFDFELMTLPARKWKWRMRLAAQHFAGRLRRDGHRFDRIICSTFLDAAAFRGMAPRWVRDVPVLAYFHENQFAYPVQANDERDVHFGITNMTTALAADSIAFNSRHNLSTFIEGVSGLMKHSTDMGLEGDLEAIRKRASVLHPGMDYGYIDAEAEADRRDAGGPPVVLWNHRWEHDKDPELFFETLIKLKEEGVEFNVAVLGRPYSRRPAIFERARKELSDRIVRFGYARAKADYARWLGRSTLVVSTARHEFFGMAVLEAVRAGCRPLLPRGLSYAELFPEEFLYDEGDFPRRLKEELLRANPLPVKAARSLTEPYSWEAQGEAYASWIQKARVMGQA